MTKATAPFTFADAAKRTIDRIGWSVATALTGRSVATLEAWRCDDNPRWPRIDQALALDLAFAAAGGDGSPFRDAFDMQVDDAAVERKACLAAFNDAAAALSKEYGDLNAATINVMHPDATQRDVDRAMVEAQQVVTRLDAFVRRLKSLCLRSAGLRMQMIGGSR